MSNKKQTTAAKLLTKVRGETAHRAIDPEWRQEKCRAAGIQHVKDEAEYIYIYINKDYKGISKQNKIIIVYAGSFTNCAWQRVAWARILPSQSVPSFSAQPLQNTGFARLTDGNSRPSELQYLAIFKS